MHSIRHIVQLFIYTGKYTVRYKDGVIFEATAARIKSYEKATVGAVLSVRFSDGKFYNGKILSVPGNV